MAMERIRCSHCGQEFVGSAQGQGQCPLCSRPLGEPDGAEQPARGTATAAGDQSPASTSDRADLAAVRSRRLRYVLAGGCALIVLAAVLVIVLLPSSGDGNADPDEPADASVNALGLLELAKAELARNRDAQDKAKTWCYIAEAQATAGDNPAARETLRQAAKTCAAIKDSHTRNWQYHDIAAHQLKLGDLGGAAATEAKVSSRSEASSSRMLAEAYAKAGAMTRALAVARATRSEGAWAFQDIALVQAGRGDKAGALVSLRLADQALAAMPEVLVERWAYHLLRNARIQIEAGEKSAALRTLARAAKEAREISDRKPELRVLCKIASMTARAGDKAAARQTVTAIKARAGKIPGGSDRDSVLLAIAGTQSTIGDISGAMHTAAGITSEATRAAAYLVIVETLCGAGRLSEAETALAKITGSREKRSGLFAVARARLKADDITGALAVAGKAGLKWPPVEVYVAVAEAQERAGNSDAALATLRQAADGMRKGMTGDHYYLVHGLARLGDIKTARELAVRFGSNVKAKACGLALAGDVDGALAAADKSTDDCWGCYGLYLRVARAVAYRSKDPARVAKLHQWVQRRDADWRRMPNYHDLRCAVFLGAAQGLVGQAEWGDVLGADDPPDS